jgi:hypothetical protein
MKYATAIDNHLSFYSSIENQELGISANFINLVPSEKDFYHTAACNPAV